MKGKENENDNELDLGKLINSCDNLEQEFVRLRLIEQCARDFVTMIAELSNDTYQGLASETGPIAQNLLDALNITLDDLNLKKEKQI